MKLLNTLRWVLRIVLPVAVVAGASLLAYWMIANQPQPQRYAEEPEPLKVEVSPLQRQDYQVVINTQGLVQARTGSRLIPQVSGNVHAVAPSFRPGGFFEEGDVLVEIDPSDYETALTIAEAELAQAKLRLAQEEAQAQQALRDWQRLGGQEAPSALTLRKPQLAEAKAAVAAAEARVQEAKRNLERTKVKAPYAGRVLSKSIDVGNYVTPGTELAQIYAVDYAEIRLPLSNNQLAFLDLPEAYRRQSDRDAEDGPPVELTAMVGDQQYTWRGRIVRTEGSVDEQSQQLYAVAQVDDPYSQREPGQPPLKVGMHVQARIQGRKLEDVIVVPRQVVRRGQEVLVVNDQQQLDRQAIQVVWSDEQNMVIRGGLEAGQQLCLTQVPFAADGAPVEAQIVDGGIREAAAPPIADDAKPTAATEEQQTGAS